MGPRLALWTALAAAEEFELQERGPNLCLEIDAIHNNRPFSTIASREEWTQTVDPRQLNYGQLLARTEKTLIDITRHLNRARSKCAPTPPEAA